MIKSIEKDNFIFDDTKNVIKCSNMSEILGILKERDEAETICKNNSLNMALIKDLFYWASKGYNNCELAKKLGVHRVTVQRYSHSLKKMDDKDYQKLLIFISKEVCLNEK